MAFRQPQQRPQAVRQPSYTRPSAQAEQVIQAPPSRRPLEESQEWVLFSPRSVAQSQTTGTSQTARTISRASDFGSLETGVRSDQIATREDNVFYEEEDDEEAELDSLDDGLHAFQALPSPKLDQSGGSILPMHDGHGTFPTSYPYADNEGMQEQLWKYERYNPQRRWTHRRRSSVQKRLDAMEEEQEEVVGVDPQEERRLRVEKWRLEQSKAVLEEMERESKRRQRRRSRSGIEQSMSAITTTEQTSTGVRRFDAATDASIVRSEDKEESESFWQRLTRRVIQDIMGLDEDTLSVIFGEELPTDVSATPTQSSPLMESMQQSSLATFPGRIWETRLLDRIARELGILVHQLSDFEGAFAAYKDNEESFTTQPVPIKPATRVALESKTRDRRPVTLADTTDALFTPTLPKVHASPTTAPDASLWGIEEETTPSRPINVDANSTSQDAEYWERDFDIRMIFNFLRTRFSSRPSSPTPPATAPLPHPDQSSPTNPPLPTSWINAPTTTASALGTSPESLRRADLIRKHHPLVSRAAERRREALLRRHHAAMASVLQKRPNGESSCASQSTKRSRSRLSSGQSRKYWDFPGGVAAGSQGSVVGSVVSGLEAGGNGSWGEV